MKPIFVFAIAFLNVSAHAQNISDKADSLIHYCHHNFYFEGVVLVAENNKIVYEKTIGDANKEWNIKNSMDTKFRLGSISKQFAAYVLFTLQQEGKVNFDDAVLKYIPSFSGADKNKITISELLHHTSGLYDYTELKTFDDKAFYTKDSIEKMIANAPLNFEPGNGYAYSNSNFFLIGTIAEKVSGEPYDSLLKKRVLEPTGMMNTGLEHEGMILQNKADAYTRGNGKTITAGYINMEGPFAAGAMYSTAKDLFKWSLFFQKQVQSNSALRDLIKTSSAGETKNLYAAGWCVLPDEILHTGHINGFSNLISIDTMHKRTIIILSNSDYHKLYVLQESIIALLNGNKNALAWMNAKSSHEELQQYEGTFTNNNIQIVTKYENNKLISYVNGRPFELVWFNKDRFFTPLLDGDIYYIRDNNNKIIAADSFQDYTFTRFEKIK